MCCGVLCVVSTMACRCCGFLVLQVHLATLKSGERVVVKVQRPGLKDLFDIDLKNIRCGKGGDVC